MKRTHSEPAGWASFLSGSLEGCSEAQKSLWSRSHVLVDVWLKSRTADLEAAMKAYSDLVGCSDPTEILQTQQRWFFDTAERLQEEAKRYGGQVSELTKENLNLFGAPRAARASRVSSEAAE